MRMYKKTKAPTAATVRAFKNLNHTLETNSMNNNTENNQSCTAPVIVPFHGASLFLAKHNDEPYVPMKPVVEGMGLDWKSQHVKISQRFSKGMVEITIPSKGGDQLMSCLPLRKLPAWLYSIQPNKVKAEIRDKVIQYQEECDEVLWQYWTKGEVKKTTVRAVVKSYLPEYRKARAMDMMTKAADRICSRFPTLSPASQQTVYASLINSVANEEVVPYPVLEDKTLTAGEVGEILGISANKVGRIANANGLKTAEYGISVLDKSKYSDKQVPSFRYNQHGIDAIRTAHAGGAL